MPDDPPPHGLDDLYDIARLADRLGVEHATIRVWLSRKVPWLPPPDGRLNGGAVWRAQTLAGLEERRRPGRPGPKPRPVVAVHPVAQRATATAAATAAATSVEPSVTTLTLPVVAPPAASCPEPTSLPLLPAQAESPDGA